MTIKLQGADASAKVEQQSIPEVPEAGELKEIRPADASSSGSAPVIRLDLGDPTIYGPYWRNAGERCAITIQGDQSLSYFVTTRSLCWFMEPQLEEEIKRLHRLVGNANVEDHHIVVGNGSAQLILAVLYALCPPDHHPVSVVSAAPYYSTYQQGADLLQSKLFRWGGDARKFDKDEPYEEIVTSPNNPDGEIREPVVNRPGGRLIHDLAYYWPQYIAITSRLDHDVMLFTASKCSGHAGSRIGWALVRDTDVAKKMTKFLEVNSIGVSKESQLRAAKILGVISESCRDERSCPELENFFSYSRNLMTDRWKRLRAVVEANEKLSLPEYPLQFCEFTNAFVEAHPAFAWMSLKGSDSANEDCAQVLRGKNIVARGGTCFGSDPKHARVSMLSKDEDFNLFLQRLSAI